MGAVYRATDTATNEQVAVKVLLDAGAPAALERFALEAKSLAKLNHPGIVGFRSTGRMVSGEAFLVMEWLEGQDLATRLEKRGVTPIEAAQIVRCAAEALSVAHEFGLVHRDVKPQNLFLVGGRADRVKVLDFGIARSRATLGTLTNPGTAMGTPAYMAPEQALADRGVDARADIFSLGCVLFECLVGSPPFVGDSVVACLANVLLTEPPRLSAVAIGIPPALDDLCLRMMAKEPSQRLESAALVAKALTAIEPTLESIVVGSSVSGRKLSHAEKRVATILVARAAPQSPTLARDQTLTLSTVLRDLEQQRDVLERYGGRVSTLADGTVIGLFSGAESPSDLARLAAGSALLLRNLSSDRAYAIATDLATLSGNTATGAAVSRAFGLATSEGKIRLDVTTRGLLGATHVIRGAAGGTELVSSTDERQSTREHVVLHGRSREFKLVESAIVTIAEDAQARVMLVVGVAGLGKSTLVEAALREAEKRIFFRHVTAFADPIEVEVPLAVLTHLMRSLFGIQREEPPPAARKKLQSSLRAHVGERSTMRVPFLEHALGIAQEGNVEVAEALRDPRVFGERVVGDVVQVANHLATSGPLVFVVEDLHACDAASLRAFERLVGELAELPFLLIGLARPELDQLYPRAFGERALERLHLLPLSRKAAAAFIRAHASPEVAIDEPKVERLVEHAAGNPLFLLELLRSLEHGQSDAPATIVALLQERLSRLEASARRVLRAASVFGNVFWRSAALALVGEEDAHDGARWLDELARKDFIHETEAPRLGGDLEFAFKHSLVRDAVYATLTDADAVVAHNLAARWLASRRDVEPIVIAKHYEQANRAALAAPYWAKAASIALERGEMALALSHVARVDALTERGETDMVALDITAAQALFWTGETHAANARASATVDRARVGSSDWLAILAIQLKVLSMEEPEQLVSVLEELLSRLERDPSLPRPTAAVAEVVAGLLRLGKVDLARRTLGVLSQGDDGPLHTAHRLRAESWIQMCAGDLGACIDLDRRSAAAYEAAGALAEASLARCATAFGYLSIGQYARARDLYQAETTRCRRSDRAFVLFTALHNLGFAHMRLGDLDRAVELQDEALRLIESRRPTARLYSHLYLGLAYAQRGEVENAMNVLGPLLDEPKPSTCRCLAFALRARIELTFGRLNESLEYARRAEQDREELGGSLEESDSAVCVALARALEATGATDAAQEKWTRARARLLERANRISDPEMRKSYLENIPEHALVFSRTSAR